MLKALWLGLAALALAVASPAAAASSRLFVDEAPLKIEITGPFPALIRAAKTRTDPFPATLTVSDGAGPAQSLPIQLSARGLTRRTAGYCAFPPLSLKFDKTTTHGTVFKGQHKLKLVTYCRLPPDYEQRIVLEHLVYRLYNLLTPMSFRVRAAEVTYRNDAADAGTTRFGFVIEDIGDVADRNGREDLTSPSHGVRLEQLDGHAAARAALFEFMIGNLDWDFLAAPRGADCCHNSRFIAAAGATPANARDVVVVPYDFDFSGFVDAPYAGPPPSIDIDSLTQRYYRGYCAHSREIPSVIAEFRAHRAEMMALIDGDPRLNAAFKAKTDRFMDKFFALIDDPGRVDREIVKHCRA
jgi:hypothetical protein